MGSVPYSALILASSSVSPFSPVRSALWAQSIAGLLCPLTSLLELVGFLCQGAHAPCQRVQIGCRCLGQRHNLALQGVEGREDGPRQAVDIDFRESSRADSNGLLQKQQSPVEVCCLGQGMALLEGRGVCDGVGGFAASDLAADLFYILLCVACPCCCRRKPDATGPRLDSARYLFQSFAQGCELVVLAISRACSCLLLVIFFPRLGNLALQSCNLAVEALASFVVTEVAQLFGSILEDSLSPGRGAV